MAALHVRVVFSLLGARLVVAALDAAAYLCRPCLLALQVCSSSGPEAVAQQLLPQLVPLFTCPDSHRLNYGMDLPSHSTSRQPPQPPLQHPVPAVAEPGPAQFGSGSEHSSGAAATASSSDTGGGGAAAGGWAGGASGSDSGYWAVAAILYPPCLEAVGAEVLHSLVPNWAVIELNLSVSVWGDSILFSSVLPLSKTFNAL